MSQQSQQRLERHTLESILQAPEVTRLSESDLAELFERDLGETGYLPGKEYQVDPRNGDCVLFSESRARRPHDHQPPRPADLAVTAKQACAICEGHTTGVIDVADLSDGFTFINKNLYPILYPFRCSSDRSDGPDGSEDADTPSEMSAPRNHSRLACGLHFLQWTSSWHERGWHNMPVSDLQVVLGRLAALEEALLRNTGNGRSDRGWGKTGGDNQPQKYISIIKNYGHPVGCSMAHDHQQIAFGNVVPRRVREHQRFEREHREPFSIYLMRENPDDLTIKDYGPAVLLTPYFMRRPYNMMLLVKDADKKHLHQLSAAELRAVAQGWQGAIRAIHSILPKMGRKVAYNVVTHNGPGAGLYFEFLPYTQETGGFEHLGLYVCQENPKGVARRVRAFLKSNRD